MKIKCIDVFQHYDLPFETYFSECINHNSTVHDEIEIIWLIKGKAIVFIDDKKHTMTSQTVIMIHMNLVHSIETSEDSIVISYRLKKQYLEDLELYFQKLGYTPKVFSFQQLAKKYPQVPLLIVQILKLLLSGEEQDITRFKIIGYYNVFTYELYTMLLKEKYLDIKTQDYVVYLNRIHAIIEYMYGHYNEAIRLRDIAEIVDLSSSRTSHFIKETIGISFRTFLQNIRLEHALRMLKETEYSVFDITKKCGFSDHKFLSKMMKDKFGLTPLQYRKLMIPKPSKCIKNQNKTTFLDELKCCVKEIENDAKFNHLSELYQGIKE